MSPRGFEPRKAYAHAGLSRVLLTELGYGDRVMLSDPNGSDSEVPPPGFEPGKTFATRTSSVPLWPLGYGGPVMNRRWVQTESSRHTDIWSVGG